MVDKLFLRIMDSSSAVFPLKPWLDSAMDFISNSNGTTKAVSCSVVVLGLSYLVRTNITRRRRNKVGRRVVVTGAASGIGRDITLLLASQGWRIWACDVNAKGLADLSSMPNVVPFHLDVRSAEQCQALADSVGSDGGSLDGLINVAGVVQQGPATGFTDEQIQVMFEINTFGPMRLTRMLIPIMLRTPRGGSIINVTSVGGKVAWPWSGTYSPSKAALNLFADSLRRESLANNLPLRITTVAPGAVSTPMAHSFIDNLKSWVARNPNSPFTPACDREAKFLSRMETHGLSMSTVAISPIKVASKVVSILNDPSPGAYYLVATWAFSLIYYGSIYLPTSLGDRLLIMI